MTPLREIRTIHAIPCVGEKGTRTVTTTFVAGVDGCDGLELAGGLVTIRGSKRTIAVPVEGCCWVEPKDMRASTGLISPEPAEYPQGAPEPSPKERDKAAHGTGVSLRGALAQKGKR